MVGILVHGDNHLILRGPLPEREAALALVRRWSLVQIGPAAPQLDRWQVVTREFRENLEWAAVVPGDNKMSPAVAMLLEELSTRGITIHEYQIRPE
jgi:hypothetical protein